MRAFARCSWIPDITTLKLDSISYLCSSVPIIKGFGWFKRREPLVGFRTEGLSAHLGNLVRHPSHPGQGPDVAVPSSVGAGLPMQMHLYLALLFLLYHLITHCITSFQSVWSSYSCLYSTQKLKGACPHFLAQ